MKIENSSNNRESRDRKKEEKKKKRAEQLILRAYKYNCKTCTVPFNLSTAMDEKTYCSLRCEGTR